MVTLHRNLGIAIGALLVEDLTEQVAQVAREAPEEANSHPSSPEETPSRSHVWLGDYKFWT